VECPCRKIKEEAFPAKNEMKRISVMNKTFVIGLLAGFSAWALVQRSKYAKKQIVPVKDAAIKLREAWADHHTSA
jgi:hypothetical protein